MALGDQRAVVTEVGAALRCYAVAGRDVVVPFDESEISPAYHGAVLLPWPNRLRDGRYEFDGIPHQLPLTEPGRQVALHGLVCWERWSLVERTAAQVTLRIDTVPVPGYPFPLRATITYQLATTGLQVELHTANLGTRDAPYGAGFHPWLSPGPGSLDECLLEIGADTWVPTDDRLLPTGYEPNPAHLDFRTARAVGATQLDDGFVDARFDQGRSWVRLTGSDGRTAAAWMDESMSSWQVCSGDGMVDPRYDRSGLAAEPMTCVADSFRTGDRLIRLAPGQEHSARWGLQLS
jgi:aldose 1-epimerase